MARNLLALALLASAAQIAGGQPVAEAPDYRVGDAWEFAHSRPDGAAGRWSREIVRLVDNDRVEVRREDGKLEYGDRALNFVGTTPSGDARLLVRYPLRVGDQWPFSRRFDNPGAEQTGSVRVVAYERITVPAGTFQCYRVEAETSGVSYPTTTYTTRIRWYCPAIKWIAKEIRKDRVTTRQGIGSALEQTSELVRYTAAP